MALFHLKTGTIFIHVYSSKVQNYSTTYLNLSLRYLDLFGGIVTVSVGHCHPKVNQALKDQVDTLWHTTNIYLHPKIHEYAERLTATLPDKLSCVYFVNSGSEANDLAMFMARLYTKNYDIITFRNGYHGRWNSYM